MTTVALRTVADVLISTVDKKSVEDDVPVRLCNYTDVYYYRRITSDLDFMSATATRQQIRKFGLRVGDVLITKDSETPDDIAVPAYVAQAPPDLVCGYHLAILRPRADQVLGSFLGWLMSSENVRSLLSIRANGVTRYGLTYDAIRDLRIEVPSMEQQARIANFLDDQVGRLDECQAAHGQLLTLLDEQVASTIGSHIAQGLDGSGSVAMTPMKKHLRKLDRPATTDAEMVTAFRDGQVIARSLRRTDGFTESWTDGAAVQGVHAGDVVVHGLDGFSGAVGTSESSGVCSPANHVCQPLTGGDPDFYGRLLRILALSGYLSLYGGSARERAVDFRNWEKFSQILLPVVPLAEQAHIGDLLRRARPLRVEVRRLHALVEERKRALITACVTGEFDVVAASDRAGSAALQGVEL